jgi:hypothetical protein
VKLKNQPFSNFDQKEFIMRIASVLTLIATAAVSFTASAAPANTNVDTSVASVAVSAKAYKPSHSELVGVQGAYALEDGRTLRVTTSHQHVYAELGDTKTELVPVARNKYASRDDAMRLVFNSSDDVKLSTAQ